MQFSIFYVPIADDGEAQAALNAFLRGHRVLAVDRAFINGGWSFCVEWLDGCMAKSDSWKQKRVDYHEVLDEESFSRFAKLRERRKAIAQEDGIPPYMVMTDAQMAEAAKIENLQEEDFEKIDGFGSARIKKYVSRILGV